MNAANARTLPIMLATKALPEMEAEERELLRRQASVAQGMPLGAQYEKLGVSSHPTLFKSSWSITTMATRIFSMFLAFCMAA